jgi:hypothetical protein
MWKQIPSFPHYSSACSPAINLNKKAKKGGTDYNKYKLFPRANDHKNKLIPRANGLDWDQRSLRGCRKKWIKKGRIKRERRGLKIKNP